MAKKNHDRYAKILREKSAELRLAMSKANAAAVISRLDHPSDEGDLSQQSHQEWIFLNCNKIEAGLLREVEAALRRIEDGSYGACQQCEEPISAKRLQAVPWAKCCVRCQEMMSEMSTHTPMADQV